MEWIKLDMDNLPDNEVIAVCFENGSNFWAHKLIGYVFGNGEFISCEDGDSNLICDCTHYIDIHKFDFKLKL